MQQILEKISKIDEINKRLANIEKKLNLKRNEIFNV